jgi:hypothetical protein
MHHIFRLFRARGWPEIEGGARYRTPLQIEKQAPGKKISN